MPACAFSPAARFSATCSRRFPSSRRRDCCLRSPHTFAHCTSRTRTLVSGWRIEYFRGGTYLPDALATVNHFLRDFRTGDEHGIDPELLDLLNVLARVTETSKPFQVISGYRSPATNEMLRHRSEGVAAGSLHINGQAIDIRLADVPLAKLRHAALDARRGGVGYTPRLTSSTWTLGACGRGDLVTPHEHDPIGSLRKPIFDKAIERWLRKLSDNRIHDLHEIVPTHRNRIAVRPGVEHNLGF